MNANEIRVLINRQLDAHGVDISKDQRDRVIAATVNVAIAYAESLNDDDETKGIG